MAKYDAEQLRRMLAAGHAMANPKGEPSYPIGDAEDLANAIRAVGRGGADADRIRRYIMRRARELGKESMIPDTWAADGSLKTPAAQTRYLAPSAVYERYSATVADVNKKQRIIDVIAVPWDQPTAEPVPFEDGMYTERFIRGAFDHYVSGYGRIAVNTGHDRSALVGRVAEMDPAYPTGLRAQLKIAAIPAGDDAIQLAREDMLAPSVGYYTKPGGYRKSRRMGTVEIRQAWLDHIALVGVPAYAGAVIDGIRNSSPPTAPAPAVDTPLIDAFLSDPVVQWAQARVTRERV